MGIASILAALLLAQDKTGEEFYKFKKDTTWTFVRSEDGKEGKMILTVLKDEEGTVHVDSKDWRKLDAEKPREETLLWRVQDGHLTWVSLRDGKERDVMRLLKLDAAKGDTWTVREEGKEKVTGTHQGTCEVTVPAGTYKDVVQIDLTFEKAGKEPSVMSMYFAPKVGLVKMSGTRAGGKTMSLELKEFLEGK